MNPDSSSLQGGDRATPVAADLSPSVPGGASSPAELLLAILATIAALHWARDFLVPVITAFFLAYTLQPLVDRLQALRVPRGLGATLVVAMLAGSVVFAVTALRDDAATSLENLPAATHKLSDALIALRAQSAGTTRAIGRVAEELQRIANEAQRLPFGAPGGTAAVVNTAPTDVRTLVWNGSMSALSVLSTLSLSLFLVFFLLQAGDFFRRKLVRVIGTTLRTKRATVEVLNELDAQVQNYVWTLFVTNSLLGLASWASFAAVGLEHAAWWALVVGILHLIPYLGPLLGAALVGVAAFTQFESLAMAAWVSLMALGLACVVGIFLMPMLSGRQARMNPTAIFIALLFFGWLWGAWGLLLGIPLTVICKVVAERIERLAIFVELLSD